MPWFPPKASLGPHQRLALVPTLPKACLGCSTGPHLPKDRMEEVTCQLCAQKVDKKNAFCLNANKLQDDPNQKGFYRCTKCNNFSSRIYRAKGRVEWASAEAKQEFFAKHNHLCGKELKKVLEHTSTQVERDVAKDQDDEDIEWLDEMDLKDKYQHKPDQLKSILDTAEQRFHPTRMCTLYGDIKFSSKSSRGHESHDESKRKCTSVEELKGPKKVKVEKVEKVEKVAKGEAEGDAPQGKRLGKGQRARLDKLAEKLQDMHVEWDSVKQNIDDAVIKAFLPQPVLEKAQKADAEVQACMAEVQVVLTEGWVGDPKKVVERVAAAAQAGLASNARVASMVKVAAEMQEEEGGS